MTNGDLVWCETPFGKSFVVVGGKEGKELGGVKDFLVDVRRTTSKKGGSFHPQVQTSRGRALNVNLDPKILA